jgi:DNA-binding MarR family transcriptional regulator
VRYGFAYSHSAHSQIIKCHCINPRQSEDLVSCPNKQGETGDMEQLNVVALIKAIHTLERDANVALMYSGLRIPQFRTLDLLAVLGQATVSELSDKLNITRATASVMANELIRSGSVAVVENLSDRRSFYIRLTDHGLSRLQVARSDLGVLTSKITSRYSATVINTLNDFAQATSSRQRPGKNENV